MNWHEFVEKTGSVRRQSSFNSRFAQVAAALHYGANKSKTYANWFHATETAVYGDTLVFRGRIKEPNQYQSVGDRPTQLFVLTQKHRTKTAPQSAGLV